MKFLPLCGSLLYATLALAASSPYGLNGFRFRARPVIEKRVPNQPFKDPEIEKRAASFFLTNKTQPFAVDGKNFPKVPFDLGESYAGLLPISGNSSETRKLFFWFFPSTQPKLQKEIVIWLNGGPGCSSLSGLLTENGPFLWQAGTLAPVQNPYTWVNLTNVLWIEQPVGVGFSEGIPNIKNEVELSAQFRGFYKNFIDLFGAYNWKTYITGESYAGYYVPYIADSFISAKDTKYFDVGGISINDPIIGDSTNQQIVPTLAYAEYWQNLLYLNSSFIERFREHHKKCGYTDYYNKYFTFPPPQVPFPILPEVTQANNYTCDQLDNLLIAMSQVNPCLNVYHITDTCPFPYSSLGGVNVGDYIPPGQEVYFNRSDVQKALHAKVGTNWQQCSDINVFGNGNLTAGAPGKDNSTGPANTGVLRRVIEHTNNTMIGSGELDLLLPTNGTLLAIQNLTWHGVQGLSKYPNIPLYAPDHIEWNGGALAGAGYQGVWIKERGLTFYTAQLAGHELPGYTPGVAYRMLEILLGRVKDFSSLQSFTTQTGNFTGTTPLYKQRLYQHQVGPGQH